MAKIESDIVKIEQPVEKVFGFLSDFNNFQTLMPPQVTNWESTHETCSFTVSGMASVAMRIRSTEPFEKIHIVSDKGKLPFEFTLEVRLKKTGETLCTGQLIFDADIPVFLRPMIEGPLRNFFNMLAQKMKDIT
ncbi:MAG TPA: SRPBCC family protein [Bacteroidia bacterium]|nr:SRPBCC family protein [Bacteroidia bacterium]